MDNEGDHNIGDEIYSNGVAKDSLPDAEDTDNDLLPMETDAGVTATVSTDPLAESLPVATEDISGEFQELLNFGRVSEDDKGEDDEPHPKRQRQRQFSLLTSITDQVAIKVEHIEEEEVKPETPATEGMPAANASSTKNGKKYKKKINVWTKPNSRKVRRKTKNKEQPADDDSVYITPVPRFPDRTDDTPDMEICMSKVYKADRIELSDDRLSVGSTKGYRSARATRGVVEGAWYFEIKVVNLGETGHTRLGWISEIGDLQAPVGCDENSYGYRDIDGSKIYRAEKEKYGDEEGYTEGDIIGFYINLPEGSIYAPKPKEHNLVLYKGQKYVSKPADGKEEDPKVVVPGSEISFFKNGICQGTAFLDLIGARYYPAASLYTLPNQPNCVVKFNFGPDFDFFPNDFGNRPFPRPMSEVPYQGYEVKLDNGDAWSYWWNMHYVEYGKGVDFEIANAAEATC